MPQKSTFTIKDGIKIGLGFVIVKMTLGAIIGVTTEVLKEHNKKHPAPKK